MDSFGRTQPCFIFLISIYCVFLSIFFVFVFFASSPLIRLLMALLLQDTTMVQPAYGKLWWGGVTAHIHLCMIIWPTFGSKWWTYNKLGFFLCSYMHIISEGAGNTVQFWNLSKEHWILIWSYHVLFPISLSVFPHVPVLKRRLIDSELAFSPSRQNPYQKAQVRAL